MYPIKPFFLIHTIKLFFSKDVADFLNETGVPGIILDIMEKTKSPRLLVSANVFLFISKVSL